MNEEDFLDLWKKDKPRYEAWGNYIQEKVCNSLKNQNKNLDTFLKIPVKYRLKEDKSIVDKAFNRNKKYGNPYEEIEDKVGIRFIVLLLEDIRDICKIIDNCEDWVHDPCRDFNKEREDNPLLFDYQSMHYILRPVKTLVIGEVEIPENTPCEVQVRTLLQHAHAELTHDAIYKSKKKVKAKTHRKVARSMALIETTDDFFEDVNNELNTSRLQEFQLKENLDNLYQTLIGVPPNFEKSSLIIWDAYDDIIDDKLYSKIDRHLQKRPDIIELIKEKSRTKSIYRQGIIFFLTWLAMKRRSEIENKWPIASEVIEEIALDCGSSYFRD
ncbi:GTP pyrophosphokinase family protein [Marinomonas posidonica]|uniref:GTP pyrophosphokinase n=1 Tax=Marinomonas posidonica TaxID=936476 RepID=UPI003736A8FB